MTLDLFVAAFPSAKWPEILALLDQDTRKAKVFRRLLPGGWVPGALLEAAGGGWDYRSRCARLRDLGVPVESRPSRTSSCHEFRIPEIFLLAHTEKDNERRRTA
jgi:hypothetical protein